jgi:hypothetical protein
MLSERKFPAGASYPRRGGEFPPVLAVMPARWILLLPPYVTTAKSTELRTFSIFFMRTNPWS